MAWTRGIFYLLPNLIQREIKIVCSSFFAASCPHMRDYIRPRRPPFSSFLPSCPLQQLGRPLVWTNPHSVPTHKASIKMESLGLKFTSSSEIQLFIWPWDRSRLAREQSYCPNQPVSTGLIWKFSLLILKQKKQWQWLHINSELFPLALLVHDLQER